MTDTKKRQIIAGEQMIKNVFFDLDGTVTEPYEGISNAVLYALKKCGASPLDEGTLRAFIGPPLRYSFCTYAGMSEQEAEKALAAYREYYSERGIFELSVYSGLVDAVESIKAAGRRVFIATSKPEPFAERVAQRYFGELFDGIAGASFDDTREKKNDVIKYALKAFRADPKESVMVGDRMYDIEGGRLFGMKTIGVLYGYGDAEELKNAGADELCAEPKDLPRAVEKLNI